MKKQIKKILSIFALSILICSFTNTRLISGWEKAEKPEVISVYEKAMGWFSTNENCKVTVQYASYTDHQSTKAYEQSNGYYKKDKKNIHTSALGIVTIQNEKVCFIVDSTNKMIVLKSKAELSQPIFDPKSFSESLDRVKALKKQKDEQGNMLYRIEYFPNAVYEASEFNVNEKGLITKVKYYYNKEVQENENNSKSLKGKPRLEITFSGYQTNVKFNYEKEFSEKYYLKDIGKNPVLNDNYKKFELKDYRFAN